MHCGAKLRLLPLHTLVVTCFYLGTAGCQNEDLLDVVCCLLSLIAAGVGPSETAVLSLPMLLGLDEAGAYSHERLSPADLAECLSKSATDR
jgi:hypothetical protein